MMDFNRYMLIGNMFMILCCILCMTGILEATTTPRTRDCYTQPPGRGSNNRVMSCLDKYAIIPGQLYCQVGKSYRPIASSEHDEIVRKHNEIRSVVTPKAGNMLTISYNPGLERTAHIWAQKCELKTSEPLQRFRPGAYTVGENVYVSKTDLTWSDVIDKWAEEKSAFTFGSAGISLKGVANYIQIIWANTSTVACSKAVCAGQYFYVCQYASAMDYDNYSTPYKSSNQSCSSCKNCTNALCDCSSITCLNGAELNLQKCQCECISQVNTYELPLCELYCDKDGDDPSCGKLYQKSACRSSFKTMFHCPWMCDLCPYAARNYTERSQPLPWERNRTECPEPTTATRSSIARATSLSIKAKSTSVQSTKLQSTSVQATKLQTSAPVDFQQNGDSSVSTKSTSQHGISTRAQLSESEQRNSLPCGNGSSFTRFPQWAVVFVFMLTLFMCNMHV